MDFITIKVYCNSELTDILIAELFELGFDSFQEFEDGFEGSCDHSVYHQAQVDEIIRQYPGIECEIKEQEKVNWNEEWEKNYDPIIVGDRCIVRASFHQPQTQFEYEIIVTPKMSFGTGHHATTYQVLEYQMELDHHNKKVLDVGTGTGILAIMAQKRNAAEILATDIDDWCIENSEENFSLNNVSNVHLIKGQINQVDQTGFDIVIANINKNVLLEQIGEYSKRLLNEGHMILSGFYQEDVEDIEKEAKKYGLNTIKNTSRDNWAMLAFKMAFN